MAKETAKKETTASLKKRVKELESQNEQLRARLESQETSTSKTWIKRLKGLTSFTLMLIAASMFVASITFIWAQRTIIDTETFVDKSTQIISEESVVKDVSDKVTNTLFEQVDIEQYVNEALPEKAKPLSAPIASGVKSFVGDKTTELLSSEDFAELWVNINTKAHAGLIQSIEKINSSTKEDNSEEFIYVASDRLMMNLRPVLNDIKSKLVEEGITFLPENNLIADEQVTFEVVQINNLPNILRVYNLLNAMSYWLPVLALAFAGVGVYFANNIRRAMLIGVVMAIVISVASVQLIKTGQYSVSQIVISKTEGFSSESALSIYKIMLGDLVLGLRWLMAIMLVVATVLVLSGPTKFAGWIRTRIGGLVGGKDSTAIRYIGANANALIAALSILVGLLIVLVPFGSPWVAIWLVLTDGIFVVFALSVKNNK